MDHTLIEVGATILTIAGSAAVAIYSLGRQIGSISTKIESIGSEVSLIRTNELHHINERFINIERVLMEGKHVGEDSTSHARRNKGD